MTPRDDRKSNLALATIHDLEQGSLGLFERFSSGPWWRLRATLLGVFVSLFLAFPDSHEIDLTSSRSIAFNEMTGGLDGYWRSLGQNKSIYHRVIIYRITIPLIAQLFRIGLPGCYAIQFVTGILLIYYIIVISEYVTHDKISAMLFCLSVSSIWAGCTSFIDFRPFFDGVALFLLVVAMQVTSVTVVAALVLLASFTDERAFVSSGFVLLWWAMKGTESNGLRLRQPMAVVAGLISYLVIRYFIKCYYHIPLETSNFEFFDLLNNAPMAIWSAYEGGWLVVLLASLILIRQRKWPLLIPLFSVGAVAIFGAVSVADMTRSIAYILPGLIIGLSIISADMDRPTLRRVLLVSAVVCIAWPTYYAAGKSMIWWRYPLPIRAVRHLIKLYLNDHVIN